MIETFVDPKFWRHHFHDALTEPLHIIALSALVSTIGDVRTKIEFDRFECRPYAFGILNAADQAKQHGIKKNSIVEFGVASGRGLLSMSRIATAVSKLTEVEIDVVGFDTGAGMPPAIDYRDHPESYFEGDFAPSPRPRNSGKAGSRPPRQRRSQTDGAAEASEAKDSGRPPKNATAGAWRYCGSSREGNWTLAAAAMRSFGGNALNTEPAAATFPCGMTIGTATEILIAAIGSTIDAAAIWTAGRGQYSMLNR